MLNWDTIPASSRRDGGKLWKTSIRIPEPSTPGIPATAASSVLQQQVRDMSATDRGFTTSSGIVSDSNPGLETRTIPVVRPFSDCRISLLFLTSGSRLHVQQPRNQITHTEGRFCLTFPVITHRALQPHGVQKHSSHLCIFLLSKY